MSQDPEAGAWRTAGAAAGDGGPAWRAVDHAGEMDQNDAVGALLGAQHEIVLHVTPPPRGAS